MQSRRRDVLRGGYSTARGSIWSLTSERLFIYTYVVTVLNDYFNTNHDYFSDLNLK